MNSNSKGGGLGICSVLTIVFVVLKLTKVITWSWWWVLCPLWINLILYVVLVAILFFLKMDLNDKPKKSRRIKW